MPRRTPSIVGLLLVFSLVASCGVREFLLLGPLSASGTGVVNYQPGLLYAESGGQILRYDLFTPADAKNDPAGRPLIIVIHGGYWRRGDRGEIADFAYDFAAHGYVAASIDYRLADGRTFFPAQPVDVLTAIRYFREHASELFIDPNRIALFGRSSGAHAALLAGMTTDASVFDSTRPQGESPNIRAIVNLFGPTDLTADPATAEAWQVETVENMLGVPLAEAGSLLLAASPIAYARADGPAILTIHGDADTIVPVSQGRSLDAVLTAAGQRHQYVEVPGMGHIDGGLWSLPFAQNYRATIFAFLAANL